KYFGTGTKLIVSDIQAKHSTNVQLLPHSDEQAGKVSYMCLIEDFYPDVIKVTWEDDNKNAEKNGVHEEIWPSDDNNSSYSMSSWLTVDKNSNKNYRCKYQHEAKEKGFATIESQETSVVPKTTAGCTNRLFTVSFMHRTAYLIYTVLLLKSTIYYVIVLFFMYRMQSPIKRQGKKP
ncbi:immunoglobulin lambda like polypeptide 5, partial [Chelydra serpentina]